MSMLQKLRKKFKNVTLMNTEQCFDLIDDNIRGQLRKWQPKIFLRLYLSCLELLNKLPNSTKKDLPGLRNGNWGFIRPLEF